MISVNEMCVFHGKFMLSLQSLKCCYCIFLQ